MMLTFLDDVIKEVLQKEGSVLRNTCVIFPTRRACLIFRKRLAEANQKPVFSPGIKSIGDFVAAHSGIEIADEIPLLLALYDVYKKHWPDQDFARFYGWGKMLISDFDETDKQLTDPARLFTVVGELKKLESAFAHDPESLEWIQHFIKSLNQAEISKIQQEFAKSWDRLRMIYDDFNSSLSKKQFGYEGRAYRQIISQLRKGNFKSQYTRFIFAGFYGFSRAEESLISLLSSSFDVKIMWDADPYYIAAVNHEAGMYFRKTSLYSLPEKATSFFDTGQKQIEITGVPLVAGQAKYAGMLLSDLIAGNQIDINKTAIILPDEKMLFPMLHSIPEEAGMINVTMGYPVKDTHFSDFVHILVELYRKPYYDKEGNRLFQRTAVEKLLRHTLIRQGFSLKGELPQGIRKPWIRSEEIELLYQFNGAALCFSDVNSSPKIFGFLEQLIIHLSESIQRHETKSGQIESVVLKFIAEEIEVLKSQLSDHLEVVGETQVWQMIKECVSGLKIPFSGEPVKGLQLMGFLESRALDFETVIIPNLNEGSLPASGSARSFIPYSLRKGFGLSTYEDQDASWAYHFYRLLHRAKNIYLIHNSEVGKLGGGEPSRYLLQIRHELKKYMGDRLTIAERTLQVPPEFSEEQPVVIQKNEAVISELNRFRTGSQKQRFFSSTALTTYLHCSLKFYFQYIAGIREKQQPGLRIEAADFGNILHHATENIYRKTEGLITPDKIDQLIPVAAEYVDEAIRNQYGIEPDQLLGEDVILAEVLRELVRRILLIDKEDAPFRIVSLEDKYTAEFSARDDLHVMLEGKFDRVDEKDGVVRIIDYKTGKVKLNYSVISEIFSKPDKKALFQLYFYNLLYKSSHPESVTLAGIYLATGLSNGINWPTNEKAFSEESNEEFRSHLRELIKEIFNHHNPFRQTEDTKLCEYCPYNQICRR